MSLGHCFHQKIVIVADNCRFFFQNRIFFIFFNVLQWIPNFSKKRFSKIVISRFNYCGIISHQISQNYKKVSMGKSKSEIVTLDSDNFDIKVDFNISNFNFPFFSKIQIFEPLVMKLTQIIFHGAD